DAVLAIDLIQTSVQRCVDNLEEETRARERVESELRIAGDIQASLLPGEFPPFPDRKEIEIHATMEPARQVGGDYYDFFFIDSRRLCLTVGDVSDKGVPAALFMAMCKTLLKSKAWRGLPCQQIVEETNDDLHADNRACMFVTLVFAVLDVETGELQLCNCGHLAPLRLSSRGLEALSGPGGPMLGVMEGTRYPSASIRLEPGDLLFLYTDGLPDAQDPAGQSYSDRRMKELLRGLTNRSPGELVREVEAAFRAFRGDRPAFDDITMLALRYWGPAGPASQEPESPVRGAPGGDPRPPRPR
ncbi:MAG: PP2C family protein-serine/threonine phosphatase, partial [Candidatus Riflebacteria bacterium]|nr:PP2C family protein-serine/threonine phosphatase [Candidatus Riflebacteria bacterium]